MDIVAQFVRTVHYGVRFLARNELPWGLRKTIVKNVTDTYDLSEIRRTSYSQNIFGWLQKYNNKDGYSKNIIIKAENFYMINLRNKS